MTQVGGGQLSLPVKITILAAVVTAVLLGGIVAITGPLTGGQIALLALVLLLPVVVAYGITRFLVGRLTVPVMDAYQRLADGDFAAELPPMTAGKDFVGLRTGFRTMATALERTLAEVRAADRERRRLFADLAHELATPTTTLLGIAAALRAGDGQRDRLLDHLERESARLERLIADVRELALLEDPAMELRFEACDLGALVTAAVERARLASARDGALRCTAPATMATVDPLRVDQILTNLLGNAVRHGGDGAIEVAVARAGADVVVRVEDSGAGVPDHLLPELGRRLLRLDPSRNRATGGHGLGLSIVRAIAARHGGGVRFERARLGGLAVEVRLPAEATAPAGSSRSPAP